MSITLKNVFKSYNLPVLSNISLFVEDGGRVCVLGGSGSGKTTLLNIIMGLEKPDSGSVDTKNARFSCVFQQDRLLPQLTAVQNVSVMLNNTPREQDVTEALLSVGIPDGELSKPLREYSGGMARRTAIVRAMLAEFDVLIMDEPFKGLDEALKLKTMEFVRDRLGDRTLIFATHAPEEAQFFSAKTVTLESL